MHTIVSAVEPINGRAVQIATAAEEKVKLNDESNRNVVNIVDLPKGTAKEVKDAN